MNFYQFHVGDYVKHTSHLTAEEDLAYRRLLDLYYDTEAPIPNDIPRVARRIRVGCDAVQNVLSEFFTLTPEGFRNHRADQEIIRYYAFLARQKANGIKGGRPKKPTANPTVTQPEPKKTLTNTQYPITIEEKEKVKKEKTICPTDVQPDTWDGFLAARKLAKAVVTERVLKSIRVEAMKAGWTMDAALAEIAARGWRGFKAEWVAPKDEQKTAQNRNKAVLGALTRGMVGGGDAKLID